PTAPCSTTCASSPTSPTPSSASSVAHCFASTAIDRAAGPWGIVSRPRSRARASRSCPAGTTCTSTRRGRWRASSWSSSMADITARDLSFHVQRLGSPESTATVVFLHGLVMDNLSSFYFTLANPVAALCDVILYDLRGHGMSTRPATGYTLKEMVADL